MLRQGRGKAAVVNPLITSGSTYQKDPTQFAVLVGRQTTGYASKVNGLMLPIPITTSQMHTGHVLLVCHMIPSMKCGMLVCLM